MTKMTKMTRIGVWVWGIVLLLLQVPLLQAQNAVTPAYEQFNKFNTVNGGWLASDATISLLLPDSNTLWLFGDCIIGEEIAPFDIGDKSTFINNAAIIEEDGVLTAYYNGTFSNPSSLIPSEDGDWFWPEHATIENDTIKIFAIRITHEDNGVSGFNFRVLTTHLAYFKYPGLEHIKTVGIDDITDTTMRFGTHVLKRDDYTFIYGKKDTVIDAFKYPVPMLARVKESVEEPWQFYAGDGKWSYKCSEAVPIGNRPMSESFFVHEHKGKFYLIMHEIWLIGELWLLEADSLTGPWNNASSGGVEKKFCLIPKVGDNFTYNLFAHPQFRNDDGDLLISFNVNTGDFWSIWRDTRNYRGRFLWLDIDEAMALSTPESINIYAMLVGQEDAVPEANIKPVIRGDLHTIYIDEADPHSEIIIYGIDGRIYYRSDVEGPMSIRRSRLPTSILLIQAERNKKVTITKFFNSH
jgi:hypothetical protein